jgi:type IV secretory pathway VirB2 component (pilin)
MRGFLVALALIVAGCGLAAAAGGRLSLQAAGVLIAGIGGVVGVSSAFYVIGRSEDRARDRDGR